MVLLNNHCNSLFGCRVLVVTSVLDCCIIVSLRNILGIEYNLAILDSSRIILTVNVYNNLTCSILMEWKFHFAVITGLDLANVIDWVGWVNHGRLFGSLLDNNGYVLFGCGVLAVTEVINYSSVVTCWKVFRVQYNLTILDLSRIILTVDCHYN